MSAGRPDIPAAVVWVACAAFYVTLLTLTLLNPALLVGPPTTLGRDSELGLIETSQNGLLLVSLVLAIAIAVRAEERDLRIWAIFIALGIFFVLGEEVSWGQHYFGWSTEGIFERINDQGETNLHNTEGGWFDQKPRAVLLAGMILGAVVHPLVKRLRNGRGLFDRPWWLAPTLASLAPVVFSQLGGLPKTIDRLNETFHFLATPLQQSMNAVRASEVEEIFIYVFFVTYTASLLRRLPSTPR